MSRKIRTIKPYCKVNTKGVSGISGQINGRPNVVLKNLSKIFNCSGRLHSRLPDRAYIERLTHQCKRVPITALNRATPRCCETGDQFAFKVVCSRRPPRLPCHPTHTSSRLPHSLSALPKRDPTSSYLDK